MSDYAEFRKGWKPLIASMIGVSTGLTGIVFYSHGVFVVPVSTEMGWSRAETQFAFSFVMMSALITAPLVGTIIDRYGSRKLALGSMVALAVAFACLSFATSNIWSYYAAWIILSLVGAGTLPVTWTRAVNQWFDRRRGLALGLTMVGTGLSATIAPLMATWLIEEFGWRIGYRGLGFCVLLFAVPVVYAWFQDKTTAEDSGANEGTSPQLTQTGLEPREVLTTYRFWLLGFSLLFVSVGISGLITNLVPLLLDQGYSMSDAAGYASLIGFSVIIGRIVVGYLIDRIWAPLIAFIFLTIPAISCLLLQNEAMGPVGISLSVLFLGLSAGAELDLIAFLTSRYFGMRHYGGFYGGQFAFFALGSGFAPAIYGRVFDVTGSYGQILDVSAVLFVVGAAMMLGLGRYPQFNQQPEQI